MPLLKILSNTEIVRFDSLPVFNHEERKKFFNLPGGLTSLWETLRTDKNKISFLLQSGYFRARQRFFARHLHPADLGYISAKFHLSPGNQKFPSYSRPTLLRHQRIIVNFYSVRFLQESHEPLLFDEAKSLVSSLVRFNPHL